MLAIKAMISDQTKCARVSNNIENVSCIPLFYFKPSQYRLRVPMTRLGGLQVYNVIEHHVDHNVLRSQFVIYLMMIRNGFI